MDVPRNGSPQGDDRDKEQQPRRTRPPPHRPISQEPEEYSIGGRDEAPLPDQFELPEDVEQPSSSDTERAGISVLTSGYSHFKLPSLPASALRLGKTASAETEIPTSAGEDLPPPSPRPAALSIVPSVEWESRPLFSSSPTNDGYRGGLPPPSPRPAARSLAPPVERESTPAPFSSPSYDEYPAARRESTPATFSSPMYDGYAVARRESTPFSPTSAGTTVARRRSATPGIEPLPQHGETTYGSPGDQRPWEPGTNMLREGFYRAQLGQYNSTKSWFNAINQVDRIEPTFPTSAIG